MPSRRRQVLRLGEEISAGNLLANNLLAVIERQIDGKALRLIINSSLTPVFHTT